MVRIVNGEIVPDDDPRVQRRNQPTRAPTQRPAYIASANTVASSQAGTAGFSWGAPPVQLLQERGPGGLPGVQIYGMRVPAVAIIGSAAAGIMFGWRGLLAGALCVYLYVNNRNSSAQGRQNSAATQWSQLLGKDGLTETSQGGEASSMQAGRRSQGHVQQQSGQGSGVFTGKSYKLSN